MNSDQSERWSVEVHLRDPHKSYGGSELPDGLPIIFNKWVCEVYDSEDRDWAGWRGARTYHFARTRDGAIKKARRYIARKEAAEQSREDDTYGENPLGGSWDL